MIDTEMIVFTCISLSVVGCISTYKTFKADFDVPFYLNMPGAILMGISFLSLFCWLGTFIGLSDSYTVIVKWYTWIIGFAVSISYYCIIIAIRNQTINKQKGKNIC